MKVSGMNDEGKKRAEWRRLFGERYKGRLAVALFKWVTAPLFFIFFAAGLYYKISPQTMYGKDIFQSISPVFAAFFIGNILWIVIANMLASRKSGFTPRREVGADSDGT